MMVEDPKPSANDPAGGGPGQPTSALIRGALQMRLRSGLARDVTLAVAVKVILLTGLLFMISRLSVRPSNSAAATAAAVAGTAMPAAP